MNKLLYVILLPLLILLSGCFIFESDVTGDTGKYRYSFKNQPAQGKIGGERWLYLAGRAEQSGYDSNELSMELFEVAPQGDTCLYGAFDNSKKSVWIEVKKTPGIYELGWTTQVVFTGNKITSLGAVEIVKCDTISKIVTGKVDGFFDDNTNVNGYFTVKYCN
ncbi:MAG: hypothetical protein JW915_18680 [Chitinispirillaceae bacterium]|nr:hypothetical protein [Chitinispirillaceae bacterium]